MGDTKFTPGPWEAVEMQEGLWHIHSPRNGRVNPVPVTVINHSRDGYGPTRKVIAPADAHLIAAAPELYEALKELLSDIGYSEANLVPVSKALKQQARAALAKADGRAL